MQHKTAILNARIEPKLKKNAEKILHELGLSNADAIRLFYKQICLQHGIPFEVKLPNKTTIKAINEADSRKTTKVKSVDDLFKDLQ